MILLTEWGTNGIESQMSGKTATGSAGAPPNAAYLLR
jgi:hypothetical protein